MSTAPRSSTQQHTQPDTRRIRQFLSKLYGNQPGWMEACYINGDPLADDCKRARWIYYTPERLAEIATYLAQLAQRYGNAYASSSLYRTKQRSRKVALPSRIIFIDDAPERSDYSMVVRTSEGSRHAYYLLEQPVDANTRADLQRRAAYAFKADTSGADIEQLVRIPGSVNTKRGGRYPVHLEHLSNRTHTVEQLRRRWREVAHLDSDPADIDWQAVERWLGNRDLIFNSEGMPWRLKNPDGQGRRLLEGKLTPIKKDGSGAYDPSMARAILVKSCILHGYEDSVIAAIALHYGNFGHDSTKNTSRIKADTAGLIGKYRKQYPHIEVTPIGTYPAKPAQPLPEVPHKSRARRDRPHKINADGLLAWYTRRIDAGGIVLMTRAEVARELKISIPTLDRLERHLRERGQLERRTSKDRRRSWVAILGAINIPQQPAKTAPDPVLSANAETAQAHAEKSTSETCIKEHTPPASAQPAPQPRLVEAVRAMRLAGAKQRKQLHRMLGEYFPGHRWTPAAIDRCYDAEREDEKRRRLMERIASMTRKELRKAIRSAEYRIAKSQAQETAEYKFWLVYRNRCERQLERTIAADNRQRRKHEQRSPMPAPALFEPEQVDAPPVRNRPHEAPSGAVCSPQQPLKGAQPGCLAAMRRLLTDPSRIAEVVRYMQHYPGFDYGDIPACIAQLQGKATPCKEINRI